MEKLRIAMLVSGNGATMREILQAVKSGFLSRIEPVLVIASKPDAGGIERAVVEGVSERDVLVLRPKAYSSSEAFGEAILFECRKRGVDFIGQYGWLPKTPVNVIETYQGMMINQHPGPLDPGRPDFGGSGMYGRRVHCARLYFVRRAGRDFFTEATVQRVAIEFDKGAVLGRVTVPIKPDDDVASLQERVLPWEHKLQIETLLAFSENRVYELTRPEPLVRKEEYNILAEAKRVANTLFPQG